MQSRKVLIVEDEEVLAKNLRTHFRAVGWDVCVARTGESAVIAASEFRPGVILVDYHLPDMNGLKTLEAVRAVHCCPSVLMTAYAEEAEVLSRAERLGIARVLAKPFAIATLQSVLSDCAAEFCAKCLENGGQPQPVGVWWLRTHKRPICGAFPQPA